ncbi:DUF2064 domain-containing protein [Nocardioides sp. P86]|uniref:TIGR04282 family arsenosugar biosynthesis glycosyltransferase n=1 Tax=Nocardioides sp. P86 TaxID=2939569 RepID=UPI00203F162C|nr:DUF2064 domain-containing protein [Nocardioides sp. P86]MCM3513768.1 DUF2064 domain-containing protein [Nocardioides sp. P86]
MSSTTPTPYAAGADPAAAPRMLVVAKAPVAGRVKTRLGADIGMDLAAEIAAASLLDTLVACTDAVGPDRCHLSLDGELLDAVHGERIRRHLHGWQVTPQVGDGFDERLVRAHADVAAAGPGPVVQVGMDTPQVTPDLLLGAAAPLADHHAVLGPAEDGGWWVLALRDPLAAAALRGVPMSTPTTHDDTRAALEAAGLAVATTAVLRDIDTVADAEAVVALVPGGRFAAAWSPEVAS